jgi:hypothetical protein
LTPKSGGLRERKSEGTSVRLSKDRTASEYR